MSIELYRVFQDNIYVITLQFFFSNGYNSTKLLSYKNVLKDFFTFGIQI